MANCGIDKIIGIKRNALKVNLCNQAKPDINLKLLLVHGHIANLYSCKTSPILITAKNANFFCFRRAEQKR